jgi:dTDP-4-dehydrorhamnose reductase
MTRVLVTGSAGQVGVDLIDYLHGRIPLGGDASFTPDGRALDPGEFDAVGVNHHELDVTDRDSVMNAIGMSRPDVIVHLAAYTAVDRAEDESATCYLVNETGTRNMSEAAAEHGAHLIAVSTDYVFDGLKGSAYVEDDVVHPLSVYGASKLAGERACSPDDTIVRTSWVMGVRGKNVVHVIADRAARGEHVRFVTDQTGTVTVASDLSRALVALVRSRPGGVWHVANTGTTTWFEIAAYVGRLLGRDEDFAEPITTAELSPAPRAVRPLRSDLDTSKFSAKFARLPEWRDGVARLVRDRGRVNS